MLQRIIAAVLALLGVASVALGVASATAWRADDPLVATATAPDGVHTLVTDPGVLETAGNPGTVTVRADGAPVVLAVGRDTDVDAWVGSDPYARVTGLADWHDLALETGEPATAPTAAPTASPEAAAPAEPTPGATATPDAPEAPATADPTGSDLWIAEVAGDGTASLTWTAQEGRWSLLAVSLGDTTPTLEISWPQEVTTPWLWPGVGLGALLLAVALVLAIRIWRSRGGDEAQWHDVRTGALPAVAAPTAAAGMPGAVPLGTVATVDADGRPLTRREIREAEAAAAAARRRGRPATGALPVVTGTVPTVAPADPAAARESAGTVTAAGSSTAVGSGPGAERSGTDPSAPGPVGPAAASATAASPATASRLPARTDPPRPASPSTAPAGASAAGPVTPASPATSPASPVPGAPAPAERASAPADRTAPAAPPASGPRPPSPSAGVASSGPVPTAGGVPPVSATASDPDDATAGPRDPGAASGEPSAEDDARRGPRLSSLAGRLPWRRSRTEPGPAGPGADPVTAPTPTSPPVVPAGPGAGAPDPAAGGAPRPVTTPARPEAPSGRPVAPAPQDAEVEEDDSVSRTQRADAWRQMWGFPADTHPQQADTADDDPTDHGTEEGR